MDCLKLSGTEKTVMHGEGVGIVWQKREEEGYGTAPYPDKKKPVSSMQPSLISTTRKSQKSKKDATQTQVHSANLFCTVVI